MDVHVHRISNRLGWAKTADKQPEDTRKEIESLIDRDLWKEANRLLVGFGQTICTPINPKCRDCDLRLTCPSSSAKKKKKE